VDRSFKGSRSYLTASNAEKLGLWQPMDDSQPCVYGASQREMGKGMDMNSDIIDALKVAYAMELETVQNYIAASVNLDGVRSEVVKKTLAADIQTEVMHAQQLAARIKTIGGLVPGSLALERSQQYLQPTNDTTDLVSLIKGVVQAEESAIAQYNKIIKLCDGRDYVTQDLVIEILAGEEEHRREFIGFLREFEKG
jgi:bacterioferritin